MTDQKQVDASSQSAWRIPDWYRRVGLSSWFFLGFVAATAVIAILISATSEIVGPLVLGAFLAVVCWPAADWLTARKIPSGLAAAGVLIGLAIFLFGVGWITAVALVDQSSEMSANLDKAVERLQQWWADTAVNDDLADKVRQAVSDAGPAVAGGAASQGLPFVDSTFGFIAGVVLGTIVFYYLLKDGRQLLSQALENEDDLETRNLHERVANKAVADMQSYFRGRTAMALANGVAIGVAVWALGVPAAFAIGVVNFIGGYIPYLGAFIGGAFGVLMALGSGGIGAACAVLALCLLVNLVLENFLEPVLLGSSLNLHPLTILLATSLGGILAGLIGLILAAPVVAIASSIKRELRSTGFFDSD